MTINSILDTAISSLQTYSSALQLTSSNITNVNTPGYARREVELETLVVDGRTAGVEIGEIRRIADSFLQQELISGSALASYFEAQLRLHDRLQGLIGSPDSDLTLSARIDEVFTSFASLAINPEDTARRLMTVEDLQTLAGDISRLSEQLQALRSEADNQLGGEIGVANSALERIFALNPAIAYQRLVGGDASGLEDQRARAVEQLAEVMDIRVVEDAEGYVNIFTRAGLTLLDRNLRQLQYQPVASVDTTSRFSELTLNLVNPDGSLSATSEPVYAKLRSGSIKGLIDMRDVELPLITAEIGMLSAALIDELNRVHNAHSAVPPPNTLVGANTGALSTDPHGFTGLVTFAVLDASQQITSQVTIDFSNPGLVTLGDVITAVNGGLAGATLSLTGGVVDFTAAAATSGIAIVNDSANPSSRAGRGFAHFFGLNDLLGARVPAHTDTGLAGTDAHGFGATGTVGIELIGPGGQTAATVTLDFSTPYATINDVITALNTGLGGLATVSLDANGRMSTSMSAAYSEFGLHIATDSTDRGGSGITFSRFFGIASSRTADAGHGVGVADRIVNDASMLATALLDLSPPAGQPALTLGDNRGILAMQAVETTAFMINAAGSLPSFNGQLSQYAGTVLAHMGQEAARVSGLVEDRVALRDEILSRRDSIAGVNLDEELANMVIYQNAYNAAARMITTANEMYDVLLTISG